MTTEPPAAAPAAPGMPDMHAPAPVAAASAVAVGVADAVAGRPRLRWRGAGVVLAFLVGGPPLGTLLVALPLLVFEARGLAPFDALGVALMMALVSYVPGALPALLTGAVAARGWPQRDWPAHARIGMIGLLLSLACLGIAFALLDLLFDSIAGSIGLLLMCSLPGLVGATLVSRLLQWAPRLARHPRDATAPRQG